MPKKWVLVPKISEEFKNKFPEQDPVILQLLYNRGLTDQEKIDEFLNPDYGQDLHDPFLFRDMKKALTRIFKALKKKEKIVVHGDYDADGVCASVILVKTLEVLGAKPGVYIPHRVTEGYGLNNETVEELARQGTKLIITVDCGISNQEEVELAKKRGMDVIITDHHQQPLKLPRALAILNPSLKKETYPFRDLTGGGVAFKLAQALSQEKNLGESFEKWLLDLVAISTVTDCSPLLGENRTLVKYGLIVLRKTLRMGLRELVRGIGNTLENLDTWAIAFQIGPRLNAAGRLDHASTAYRLLMTDSAGEARELAQSLNQTNQERQKKTNQITEEARNQIGEVLEDQRILFALGKDWPTGLLGLVAGKIEEEFYRPTIVISQNKDKIVGSGRSIPEFNIIEAIQEVSEFLARYGGHPQACGFTFKKETDLAQFQDKLTKIAEDKLKEKELIPILNIDSEVILEDVNWDFFGALENFQPLGEANPNPKFLARNLEIMGMKKVGQNGQHLRLMLTHQTQAIRKTIGFSLGDWNEKLKIGDKIDMVFEVGTNEWNGNRELELKIIDLRLSQDV